MNFWKTYFEISEALLEISFSGDSSSKAGEFFFNRNAFRITVKTFISNCKSNVLNWLECSLRFLFLYWHNVEIVISDFWVHLRVISIFWLKFRRVYVNSTKYIRGFFLETFSRIVLCVQKFFTLPNFWARPSL